MTPQAPSWVSEPWQNYAKTTTGLMDTTLASPMGPTDLQKQAYAGAGSLGLLKDVNLDPYLSPYTNDVIVTATNDLDVARKRALLGNSAASINGGTQAWMGDRAGVADSLTNEGFLAQIASMSAQLRQQAYENAQRAAQGDIENARANALLQSDLGDKEQANSPEEMRIKRLAQFAALLGQIPAELFTPKVTDSSSKGSGMSTGFDASFSSKYGFQ